MQSFTSKLELSSERLSIEVDKVSTIIKTIFLRLGCSEKTSGAISEHLIDANLCGVESHGIMRVLQYAEQMQNGTINVNSEPNVITTKTGATRVDGGMSIGIPVMTLAYDTGMNLSKKNGLSALSVINSAHTGRHGAFADIAAKKGFLTICTGGGNRHVHNQVTPHGGARGMLPTNPWCIGIPGGDQGPVVMDFATGKVAGGWLYAARSAGAKLPEGCIIDRDGNPTQNPNAYFDGGAILPMGGHKGYALSLMAELIGEAMLGPSSPECNWFLLTVDTKRFRDPSSIQAAAEEVLSDIRNCPPAKGFDRVEIPGERERNHRELSNGLVAIPEKTWKQIITLSEKLNKDSQK